MKVFNRNMQFTARETKLIERLRKEERRWPYVRWFMLVIGVLALVLGTAWSWLLYKLVHEGFGERLDAMDVFILVMLWTKCCMWFVIGVGMLSKAWAKWHGDANRALLLRLLEQHQVEKVTGSSAE